MNIKTLEYIHNLLLEDVKKYTRLKEFGEKEAGKCKEKMKRGECTAEEYQKSEKEAKQAGEWARAAVEALNDFETQKW